VREFKEMTGSTSAGSKGGIISVGSSDVDIREVSKSSSKISSDTAIQIFCSLHLWPGKYLSSQL
jgi:hypothetical protein